MYAVVAARLLPASEKGETVNLNWLRQDSRRKFDMKLTGGLPKLLTNVISAVAYQYRKELLPLLKTKPIRSASGIAVVALMYKPHRCPHIALTGNVCMYCPGRARFGL